MARKSTKGMQKHPEGGVISLSPEERLGLLDRARKIGLDQKDLATKAGVSQATISNIRTGRSGQIKRDVYARVLRALRIEEGTTKSSDALDAAFKKIIDGVMDLEESSMVAVANLVDSLRKPRQSGTS